MKNEILEILRKTPDLTLGGTKTTGDEIQEMIFNYIRTTWYESKCKNPEDIQQIIQEELKKHPNYMEMPMKKLRLQIKRRCMAEL